MKYILLSMLVFSSLNSGASVLGDIKFTPYGLIKISAVGASRGVGSNNTFNEVAATQAAPDVSSINSINDSRLSFQAQQSRLGFTAGRGKYLSRFEFDFVDFNKSSPNVQMNPRLRVASIMMDMDSFRMLIGQDWDMFSPGRPYTYNVVGNYFMSGNVGFMRQQIQLLKDVDQIEYGFALGMAGTNVTNVDNDNETSKTPSVSTRLSYKLEKGSLGASALYSNFKYNTNGTRHDTWGLNFFFDNRWGNIALKSEAYLGQNLVNMGTQALGKGTATSDAKEFGGYFTVEYVRDPSITYFTGAGLARITNQKEITAFNWDGKTGNYGLNSNMSIKAGAVIRVMDDVFWMTEITHFETDYKLATQRHQVNSVQIIDTGLRLVF